MGVTHGFYVAVDQHLFAMQARDEFGNLQFLHLQFVVDTCS